MSMILVITYLSSLRLFLPGTGDGWRWQLASLFNGYPSISGQIPCTVSADLGTDGQRPVKRRTADHIIICFENRILPAVMMSAQPDAIPRTSSSVFRSMVDVLIGHCESSF